MKVGDIVSIYQRPVTGGEYEGEARIVEVKSGHMNLVRCKVRFGDGATVDRVIMVDDSGEPRHRKADEIL